MSGFYKHTYKNPVKEGKKFEKSIRKIFRWSLCRHSITSNVIVELKNGDTSETDHIYICKKGIFFIECKYHMHGFTYGELYGQWALINGTNQYPIINPILQNAGHIRKFQRYLSENGMKLMDMDSVFNVYITNSDNVSFCGNTRHESFFERTQNGELMVKNSRAGVRMLKKYIRLLPDRLTDEEVAYFGKIVKKKKAGWWMKRKHVKNVKNRQKAFAHP